MTAPVDIGTLIVSTPGTVGGRPRIAGTRISVATVALCWQTGYSAEEIVTRIFTHLSVGQVYAALAYYLANREAIDAAIAADNAEYDRLAAEAAQQHQVGPRGTNSPDNP